MRISFLFIFLLLVIEHKVVAQKKGNDFPIFDHSLLLETKADTTANVSFADFNGDGHPDILLVKGRHWPIVDRVLLGDGKGNIQRAYDLSTIADRSYTGAVADFNGDGFPDIAISNDAPDKKLIYFNDGKGNFKTGSEFGLPEWPTRNISIADINADGWPDIILANRGDSGSTVNYICLNQGKGQFSNSCIPVARYPTTTIAAADMNRDGIIDLVVPHRDGGQSYVYIGDSNRQYSDNRRIPFGPTDATIRVAAAADFNGDAIPDIATIDENKGVTIYYGQNGSAYSAGISLASAKPVPYALAIADLNKDGKMDIIVGHIEAPSTIFYNNGDGRVFTPVLFGDSEGTVYGFAIGDFNGDKIPDIAAARSEGRNVLYFGNNSSKRRK
ncbi:MAG: VCBS repeat-containing protein [Chitinophagaceae bacterium]